MSSEELFSEHWFRISEIKPALAPDVEVVRQVYRRQPFYVLRRASIRTWHRVSASTYELIARFNGRTSVQEAWEITLAQQGAAAPGQMEVINLLGQLHEADLLVVESRFDTDQLLQRRDRLHDRDNRLRYLNPLFLRIKLIDPDRLLSYLDSLIPKNCLMPLIGSMLLLWLLALGALLPNGSQLAFQLSNQQFFDPRSILLVAMIYPVMKLLHELGHALVVKRYGGDVREFGVALLVLLPNPYVDASATNMFANKFHRILVSSVGILVEVSLAAVATLIWLNSTGLVQSTALSVMVIGCVSTLLFNGNPLLKFDGYYILADWLEIPNMTSRSRQYLLGILARATGARPSERVLPADKRERFWLMGYGVLSCIYRVGLMMFIAWMLAEKYFFFGAILALYVLFSVFCVPLWKLVCYVNKQAEDVRKRIVMGSVVFMTLFASVSFAVPVPRITVTDGIVWLPEQAVLRLNQQCTVSKLHVVPGAMVKAGTRLFDCDDSQRRTEVLVLEAELRGLDAEWAGLMISDPVNYQNSKNSYASALSRYKLAKSRLRELQVVARSEGQFLIEGSTELEGRYFAANAIAGYVVPSGLRTIRLALTQGEISWIQGAQPSVQILLDDGSWLGQSYVATINRQTPKASFRVLTPALTTLGGGRLPAEQSDNGLVLREPVFEVELAWPTAASIQPIGSRVKVRFDQGSSSLAQRLEEVLRNLLLRRDES